MTDADDIAINGNALLRLMTNKTFYEYKQERCARIQDPFYDQRSDWDTAPVEVLTTYADQHAAVSGRIEVNLA